MSKVNLYPAKTEVVEVEPAKVTFELTMEEAQALRTLLGKTTRVENPLYGLFSNLAAAIQPGKHRVLFQDVGTRGYIKHVRIRFMDHNASKGDELW